MKLSRMRKYHLRRNTSMKTKGVRRLHRVGSETRTTKRIFYRMTMFHEKQTFCNTMEEVFFRDLFRHVFLFKPREIGRFRRKKRTSTRHFSRNGTFFVTIFRRKGSTIDRKDTRRVRVFFILCANRIRRENNSVSSEIYHQGKDKYREDNFRCPQNGGVGRNTSNFVVANDKMDSFFFSSFSRSFESILQRDNSGKRVNHFPSNREKRVLSF